MDTHENLNASDQEWVRKFREDLARYLDSATPVAVNRHAETLGVYVPTLRRSTKAAETGELKAAADRLTETLARLDEETIAADFKQRRRKQAR